MAVIKNSLLISAALSLGLSAVSAPAQSEVVKPVRVEIVTDQGKIEVEIDAARAPKSAENFLWYVDQRHYDGGTFHRTVREDNQQNSPVKIAVVQAGINPEKNKPELKRPPIALERTNQTGLKHLDGTLSMARFDPDTATFGFFVCIGNQPELDYGGKRNPDGQGFAAFGKVIRGMSVIKKIHSLPAKDQNLDPPVRIISAKRMGLKGPTSTRPGQMKASGG